MTNNVAIYLDFENLALSAETVYPSKNRPLEIEPIVDYAATKGNISLKLAYGDWSKAVFAQYQSRLMQHGFELVHMPETNTQGKNGSDVRLAIDVMDHIMLYPTINTIIIGSGDSDFIPLIQRVRMRSKEVIVTGFEHSVGRLVKINSVEFKSLEELIGKPETETPAATANEVATDLAIATDLLLRYVKNRNTDEAVPLHQLKQDLQRLDPTFSERKLGFNNFRAFLEKMKPQIVDKIEKDDRLKTHVAYFKQNIEQKKSPPRDIKKEAAEYLKKQMRYHKSPEQRKILSSSLFTVMSDTKSLSMQQMNDHLYNKNNKIPRIDIQKFIQTLYEGKALKQLKYENLPLLQRQMVLRSSISSSETLEQVYIGGISFILKDKFPSLDNEEIRNLLAIK
ncbi:MAG: NYN domain-containing protein [Chitinophagales bacterium]|nr:NYN domain-containing protein [Bacteroidota bacterium]MCB9043131.1 NYN domain-containing protein [Chitinophagales bacterium]